MCQAFSPPQERISVAACEERAEDPVFSNSPGANIFFGVATTIKESEEPSLEDVIKRK